VKLILHENLFSRCRKKRTKKRQFFIKYSSFQANFRKILKQNVTINLGRKFFLSEGDLAGEKK